MLSWFRVLLRSKYKVKGASGAFTILYNVAKLEITGALVHVQLKKPKISRKYLEAKNIIEKLIEENYTLYIRKLSVAAKISFWMTQDILK